MRYKRLIAALPAAIFLLGAVAPATAGDGRHKTIVAIDAVCNDHPWQDENGKDGGNLVKRPLGFVIGPLTFTVNIAVPFTQKPSQAQLTPVKNTTTQKDAGKRK